MNEQQQFMPALGRAVAIDTDTGRLIVALAEADITLVTSENMASVGGTAVAVNSGNASAGCQRVVIATDDVNLAAISTAMKDAAAAAGIMTVVGKGRQAAPGGAPATAAITLHASTVCKYFRFWLDSLSSTVRVNADGTAADATSPKFDDTMGVRTIKLATPAKTITVYFDGAVGYLNWEAGN